MIRVIVCGYKCSGTIRRCIDSILKNRGVDYDITASIDYDDQLDCVRSAAVVKDYPPKVRLITTAHRKYLIGNTVGVLERVGKPGDIIVLVDADDYLYPSALRTVDDTYRKHPETLVTHGTYRNMSNWRVGKFNGEYRRGESFRTSKWRGSHLKTFRFELWKYLPVEELIDKKGRFFRYCADRAIMIPLLEMAGHDRVKYISEPIYVYDDTNAIGVERVARQEQKAIKHYITKKMKTSVRFLKGL